MVNTIVALDDGLTPVKNYLTRQGCQVIGIKQAQHKQVDAVVLSGIDQNFLGIEDIMIDAPVISAQGLTPEEIWSEISRRSRKQ